MMLKTDAGGMLTSGAIRSAVKNGNIIIEPFDESRLNPNSYNLRLHPQLKVYSSQVAIMDGETYIQNIGKPLDSKRLNPTTEIIIPKDGFTLMPGILYIGRTIEITGTNKYIPMLNGRSSGGRLGLNVHICAGFGDIGFSGSWTLEITVVHPLIIYPEMEICQVCFYTPYGKVDKLYKGKYLGQIDATPSKMYDDFNE